MEQQLIQLRSSVDSYLWSLIKHCQTLKLAWTKLREFNQEGDEEYKLRATSALESWKPSKAIMSTSTLFSELLSRDPQKIPTELEDSSNEGGPEERMDQG